MKIEHVQHDMGQPALRVAVMCEKEGSPTSAEVPVFGEKSDYRERDSDGVNGGWGHYELSTDPIAELDGGSLSKKEWMNQESRISYPGKPLPPEKDVPLSPIPSRPQTRDPPHPTAPRSGDWQSTSQTTLQAPKSVLKSQWERQIR